MKMSMGSIPIPDKFHFFIFLMRDYDDELMVVITEKKTVNKR